MSEAFGSLHLFLVVRLGDSLNNYHVAAPAFTSQLQDRQPEGLQICQRPYKLITGISPGRFWVHDAFAAYLVLPELAFAPFTSSFRYSGF